MKMMSYLSNPNLEEARYYAFLNLEFVPFLLFGLV